MSVSICVKQVKFWLVLLRQNQGNHNGQSNGREIPLRANENLVKVQTSQLPKARENAGEWSKAKTIKSQTDMHPHYSFNEWGVAQQSLKTEQQNLTFNPLCNDTFKFEHNLLYPLAPSY